MWLAARLQLAGPFHSIDYITRLVVKPRPALSWTLLSRALFDLRLTSASPLQPQVSTTPSPGWQLALRTHAVVSAIGVYFHHEDLDQLRQSPPLCSA